MAWGQGGPRKAGRLGGAAETARPEAGPWIPASVRAGVGRALRGHNWGLDMSGFQFPVMFYTNACSVNQRNIEGLGAFEELG